MFINKALIVSALAASGLCIPSFGKQGFCGAPSLDETQKKQSRVALAVTENEASAMAVQAVTVPTYFHVVASSRTEEGGYLTRDQIMSQLDQLNQDFAGTGFSYTLADIDWTINTSWAADRERLRMRKALRKGSYGALNIYFQPSRLGGDCYFPGNFRAGSDAFYLDGCHLHPATIPGGYNGYFQGKIASHEVGHWLALFHTFENGCNGNGDEVADTPAEAVKQVAQNCPAGADTCPNQPGQDPIHNHMTYTDDNCRNEFTPGQTQRMNRAWTVFRAGK